MTDEPNADGAGAAARDGPSQRGPSFLEAGDEGALRQILRRLASLKLTLVILALLGAGVIATYNSPVRTTWALVVPLTLFALNLSAAVATNSVFRRQGALLIFHLALILIVLLVAAGRLTYLKGQIELAEGETFAGELANVEAGPWHWWRLDRISFTNDGFDIDYAPGVRRGKTSNRVRWIDEEGEMRSAVIGDNHPLVIRGYRFYTSFNKGFAPLFLWTPRSGEPQQGAVHLPAYPLHEYRQAMEWTPPGSRTTLWTMLQFDEVLLDPDKPSQFRLPSRYQVVMRVGDQRRELQVGEKMELPDGTLTFLGLKTWMGYTVFSDWTTSWLLAACAVAVGSLAWHFWRKFSANPWNRSDSR